MAIYGYKQVERDLAWIFILYKIQHLVNSINLINE